ncbi:hypothetical protein FQN57_001751 [Myotisia sp. PD_48]|nr:hypothetical protein FQN57_001751 [Myotisia sp. PD_48]
MAQLNMSPSKQEKVMADQEPPDSEEVSTLASRDSFIEPSSARNSRVGCPRFMTPVDPSQPIFSRPASRLRRASIDLPKGNPETPTHPARRSPTRSRQKSWATVAARSVDALRSSTKSINYSKRIPYRQSPTSGAYRLLSVTRDEPPTSPQLKAQAVTVSEEASSNPPQPAVDKALPSEKPLPSTPSENPEAGTVPDLARSIIDAEEVPLCRSPIDHPHVKEDWPVLLPVRAKNKGDQTDHTNEDITSPLASIEEERSSSAPCGVKMFNDALSKLSEIPNLAREPEEVAGKSKLIIDTGTSIETKDKLSSPIYNLTTCDTPNSDGFPDTPMSLADGSPIFGINSRDTILNTESPLQHDGVAMPVMYTSNPSKPNPFRNRSMGVTSPTTAINPLRFEKRAASYSFEYATRSNKPLEFKPKVSTGRPRSSTPTPVMGCNVTPRHERGGTRIPRVSPRTLTSSAERKEVSNHMTPLSPTKRSAIPIPSRFLQRHMDEDMLPPSRMVLKPCSLRDRVKHLDGPQSPSIQRSARMNGARAPITANKSMTSARAQEQANASSESTDESRRNIKTKQLSKIAPSHGPQLRISPDAERVIMGANTKAAENNLQEARGQHAQLRNKREYRLSTDSLFSAFTAKRSKHSLSRLSLSGKIGFEGSSPPLAGKAISKAKSADFGLRHSSSIGRTDKMFSHQNTETNPFRDPSIISLEEKASSDHLNSGSCGNIAPESSHHTEVSSGDAVPSKVKESPRSTRRTNGSHRKGSPKTSRTQRSNSHPSSRKNSHKHADKTRRDPQPEGENLHKHEVTRLHREAETAHKGKPIDAEKKRHKRSGHRGVVDTEEPAKGKPSSARGVLSNFRGLFMKHKLDVAKEGPPTTLLHQKKSSSKLKAPDFISHPISTHENPNGESLTSHEVLMSPAMTDTGTISSLTMEILDSARREVDNSRKEKLIRLGKILIEAVNHSHDAEKAMLTAVQAAKEAEIACAMSKQNALKMSEVARDWAREH